MHDNVIDCSCYGGTVVGGGGGSVVGGVVGGGGAGSVVGEGGGGGAPSVVGVGSVVVGAGSGRAVRLVVGVAMPPWSARPLCGGETGGRGGVLRGLTGTVATGTVCNVGRAGRCRAIGRTVAPVVAAAAMPMPSTILPATPSPAT